MVATGERKRTDAQRAVSSPVKKYNPVNTTPTPPMPKITLEKDQMPVKSHRRKSSLLDTDRGRLFVRVQKLSKVLLPALETKNSNFYMVLDNGLHSITTPLKPLRKESLLEQEFELVVGTNLEFILTCKAKWPKVASSPLLDNISIAPSTRSLASRASINSTVKSEKSKSGFSKLFSKKKTLTHDSIRPVASGRSVMSSATVVPQITKDPWEDLTAVDGSFGRIYVAFSQYESEIYGRAATFEIPLYNEWSTNHISLSGIGKKVKKEPYQIGTLQVQMMFVPRASKSEELPGSIKEALNDIRDAVKTRERQNSPVVINEAEEEEIKFNGYLSQLGGDCKYWRRRFFVLHDTTLTAFSETSHKPRAVVNLKKAIRIIQDKDTLIKPSSDKRRKSGFAENEDGYLFADQGFRISFLNGEIIEFYGDNKADWVKYLNKVIAAKDVLLAKEEKRKQKIQQDQNDLAKEKPWVSLLLDSKA